MKYNYFDKEQSHKADKKYPFKADTLYYNSEKDLIKQKPKPDLRKRLPATRRKIAMVVRYGLPATNPKAIG